MRQGKIVRAASQDADGLTRNLLSQGQSQANGMNATSSDLSNERQNSS
jgi:hypothetical protein